MLRTQILTMDSVPDLGKVHGFLISEEQTKVAKTHIKDHLIEDNYAMVVQ